MKILRTETYLTNVIKVVYNYSHPWETVAQAAWRKYPNPMNTAVIGTDVLERRVVNGILHTHRLVSSKWLFPTWAQPVSYCLSLFISYKNKYD